MTLVDKECKGSLFFLSCIVCGLRSNFLKSYSSFKLKSDLLIRKAFEKHSLTLSFAIIAKFQWGIQCNTRENQPWKKCGGGQRGQGF